MHVLFNVSRGKGNQAMKFGKLIEYNKRNIFLEKSYTNCGGENIPGAFQFYQNILKLSSKPLVFTW